MVAVTFTQTKREEVVQDILALEGQSNWTGCNCCCSSDSSIQDGVEDGRPGVLVHKLHVYTLLHQGRAHEHQIHHTCGLSSIFLASAVDLLCKIYSVTLYLF